MSGNSGFKLAKGHFYQNLRIIKRPESNPELWNLSANTAGRLASRRDFRRQNRRKPIRCQRSRVSGLKMIDDGSREGNSR